VHTPAGTGAKAEAWCLLIHADASLSHTPAGAQCHFFVVHVPTTPPASTSLHFVGAALDLAATAAAAAALSVSTLSALLRSSIALSLASAVARSTPPGFPAPVL